MYMVEQNDTHDAYLRSNPLLLTLLVSCPSRGIPAGPRLGNEPNGTGRVSGLPTVSAGAAGRLRGHIGKLAQR